MTFKMPCTWFPVPEICHVAHSPRSLCHCSVAVSMFFGHDEHMFLRRSNNGKKKNDQVHWDM